MTIAEVQKLRRVIRRARWQHSTSPEYRDAPHSYIVFHRCPRRQWSLLTAMIRKYGVYRTWRGHRYKYLIFDGYAYWNMWPVLNRALSSTLDPSYTRERKSPVRSRSRVQTVEKYVDFEDSTPIATTEQFKAALQALRDETGKPEKRLAMLRAQYEAPNQTISTAQLANKLGYANFRIANMRYGALAHRIADKLHYRPGPFKDGNAHWWFTLSYWNNNAEVGEGKDQWIMRPELAQALRELKWF